MTPTGCGGPAPSKRLSDYLGLAAPTVEIKQFGSASCRVRHITNATAGHDPGPGVAELCQRSGDGLAVQIRAGSQDLSKHPQRVVALLNQAWDTLS